MAPSRDCAPLTTKTVDDIPMLTENARKVLEARYLKKNEAGECVEAPADLFRRVARTMADIETAYGASGPEREEWEDRFYALMTSGDYMPNSPTLMNAGREMGMLSACFVLPVRDSVSEIFNSIRHTALIQKAGGGTGFAFDELRPTGDFIASSGGTTSGPITFWKAFSEATNAIQQGAFRRGANMGMMYIHHPDILKFLHAKQDLSQFTNYNISVKVTDRWMDDYIADPDAPHVVRNPRNGKAFVLPRDLDIWKYDIRHLIEIDCVEPPADAGSRYYGTPRLTGELPPELRGKVYTKRDIWNLIVNNAWQTGEPGVVFIDRINEHNPTPHVGRIEATNPCGEQPLLPYEACNLGSINLGNFIRKPCTPEAHVDWDRLREVVQASTRFLDNVIDANNYPLEEIDRICKANRKIGLGIMGFADALFKLNVAYNSEQGVAWGERFMKFVNDEAHNYSEELARSRGCFPNWKGSIWHLKHNRLMRNSAVTTVAPTGTISIIANCSGGIEPMFSLAFIRNVLRGQKQGEKPLVEVNETFRSVAAARGFLSDALLERIAREGTLHNIAEIPDDIRRVFVCAHDITPEWHMQMQAAFQRHCDSSISKTINFPNAASRDDVEKIYKLAYELRCKGVTVYRDGCRSFQPMALKKDEAEGQKNETAVTSRHATENAAQDAERAAGRGTSSAAAVSEAAAAGNGAGQAAPSTPPSSPAISERESRASAAAGGAPIGGTPAVATSAALAGGNGSGQPAHPSLASAPSASGLPSAAGPKYIEPMDLPEIVSGIRIRQMTPFGNMHVKLTVDPRTGRELEVFAQLGKGGDVANGDLEGMCRAGSLWLRAGGSLKHLIKQWEGIGSSLQIPTRMGRIMSLPDGLSAALSKYLRAKERFGLRAILLGEVDPAELSNPSAPPHTPARLTDRPATPADRMVDALPPTDHAVPATRDLPSRDIPSRDIPSRDREGAVLSYASAVTALPSRADAPLSNTGNGNGNGHGNGYRSVAADVPVGRSTSPGRAATSEREVQASAPSATAVLDASPAAVIADILTSDRLTLEGVRLFDPAADYLVDASPAALDTLMAEAEQLEDTLALDAGDESSGVFALPAKHTHDAAPHYKLKCPECGGPLALQEGCRKCYSCGWGAC